MRFREIRKARKLTQQQVANLLEIPLRTYQNYEREVNDPDTDILCKLADYYGITTDYLIGYSDIAVASQNNSFTKEQRNCPSVSAWRSALQSNAPWTIPTTIHTP